MTKTVVLMGALDTKGEEFAFVKRLIEERGLPVLVVDFGTIGRPAFAPDVSAAEVAAAGGGDLHELALGDRKDEAMRVMASGVEAVARRLHAEDRLHGVLGMGGSGGTSIATAGMRALPFGVPKVMVSTVAGGDVSSFAGIKDIVFMPSIVDVAGINRISRGVYAQAAAAISAMVEAAGDQDGVEDRPVIVASMNGNTTACVEHVRGVLEGRGYEMLIFHTTGVGGRTLEGLVSDGLAAGCLDLTTVELAQEVVGGPFAAGPDRCTAGPLAGVPTLLAPGCVDMIGFRPNDTIPDRLSGRPIYHWNPDTPLVRSGPRENRAVGEMIAAAANAAKGPVAVMVPLKGVSMLDSPEGVFWDPEADRECFDAIKTNLNADVELYELPHNIADKEFAKAASEVFVGLLERATSKSQTVGTN